MGQSRSSSGPRSPAAACPRSTSPRTCGSSTAAALLQRFVNDVPWAHLDIAGTAMGSPQNEINKGWASGWGVRLLDRLVRDHFEA